jgi:hypothetical protein
LRESEREREREKERKGFCGTCERGSAKPEKHAAWYLVRGWCELTQGMGEGRRGAGESEGMGRGEQGIGSHAPKPYTQTLNPKAGKPQNPIPKP